MRDDVKKKRHEDLGNEAPMVITPRAVVDLVRRIVRFVRLREADRTARRPGGGTRS